MVSTESHAATTGRCLPVLLVLFVASGAAALIYEIVWFQLLQLVIGSSAVSLGVLLGTFMGGMCAGSLLFAPAVSARRHPLRVYAALELGMGACGLLVPLIVPRIGGAYMAMAAPGAAGLLLRAVVCGLCVLPPTLLMGATLPAIARWIRTSRNGVAWLGLFYGGNTAGAVVGCLLAGFYLLRVYDTVVATSVAVVTNVIVAALAWTLAAFVPHEAPSRATEIGRDAAPARGAVLVYITIAISGFTALAAEVIWTRLLSLLLGATVYSFSIILAVFLIGIGLGSAAGSSFSRGLTRPKLALGLSQLLLAVAIAWSAYLLGRALPLWPINPAITTGPASMFQVDLVRCLAAVLPAACLWGASFPLALAAVASPGEDPGRTVGRVYAANTIGAIAGALGASLLLVRWVGTSRAQQLLIVLSGGVALITMAPAYIERTPIASRRARALGATVVATAVTLACVWIVPPVPWLLVAYGRYAATWAGQADPLYVGEGLNASVAVTQLPSGAKDFHVNGTVEASSEPRDMRLERMLGELPALVHGRPASVLVMGFGAGVTAGAFLPYPDVRRVVICEIEPIIPEVVAKYFSDLHGDIRRDPRVSLVFDDARHFAMSTPDKFDVITSDPAHPWVKGSAALYTKEYFDLLKAHLNPGGVVAEWVPLYESRPEAVKSEIATFFAAFPDGTIWADAQEGRGYDLVLLGRATPGTIDVDAITRRLGSESYAGVLASLREVGFESAVDVLATYAGQGRELAPWLAGATINSDRSLRLQYLAALGVDGFESDRIYAQMIGYRRSSEGIFTGTVPTMQALWDAIRRPPQ